MSIISGRIYKPERILYYIEPSELEKEEFYRGNFPESLMKYNDVFGSYDYPGLFIIKEGDRTKEILGIELRPNDDRINYPDDLKSITLQKGFMISSILPDVSEMNDKVVYDSIAELSYQIENILFSDDSIKPMKNPSLIQVFTYNGHYRILVMANQISAEEFFDKIVPQTAVEKRLYNVAYHDNITGHSNWNYLWPIIAGYGLKGIQDYAFVHFDVKEFNAINVVYGHDVANEVLIKVTKHMQEMDWVYYSCRCDNDNFSMMIKDMPEQETMDKLYSFFEDLSRLEEDENYRIYYRCGVVPMRNSLLLGERVADAGKQVQRRGTKPHETEVLLYTDSMRDELEWSVRIRTYMDTAIEKDEFLVYLQPKYDISNESLNGAEALIRWKYHGGELLSPWRFIPIFETGGLIGKLDEIVLNKVCSYLKGWKEEGKKLYPISVNLSRKSIGEPGLVDKLTSIVDNYGVDHSLIEFEITEGVAYENLAGMVQVIKGLKAHGFRMSMDDFGTGFSSLSLISAMPFDTIKIDKSFVDGVSGAVADKKAHAILKHVIAMIKDINLTCLAEGAEEKEQIEVLKEFGCELVQGYYYSKPLPPEEYEALI